MSIKFVICIALIVIAAEYTAATQQNDIKLKAHSLLNKLKMWIHKKFEQFKQKVLDSAKKLKDFRDSLLHKGLTHIHEPAVLMENDLEAWRTVFADKCIDSVQTELHQVKTATAKEFFKCTNLSNAFVDGAKLVAQAAAVVVKLTKLFSNVAKAVIKCQPFLTPKGLKCVSSYVINFIEEFKEDYPVVKNYIKDMIVVGKDMKAQLDTCLHPHRATMMNKVTNMITYLKTCSAS